MREPRLRASARVIALCLSLGGCLSNSGGVEVAQCTPNGVACEESPDCCSNNCKGDPSGAVVGGGVCAAGTGGGATTTTSSGTGK